MNEIRKTLDTFSSAEEFLDFLEVEYAQPVVHVNRLHILKRFNQYMGLHKFVGVSDAEIKAEYKTMLQKAYGDFVNSNGITEKVFKVFQDATGVKSFSVDSLLATMPVRKA